ncbi:tRNA adenosine(34) deaminase TadA [Aliidiomarina minuta]|uniref:tRNA-specific adenosine deaminase n=1 Tax=Aliidiomarina minuta TaxID=880057 RepID=A0A432WAI2_9GAMM|nr:tRNA adenosine(34) deaminase TadA [Aliidiomarina minuta]RUO27124.1 tRNA adenosine(34) deaminase TadA [Aliidiomarina minuta]
MPNHEDYMRQALDLAAKAESQGEVPVGAVLVHGDKVIGEGYNQVITRADPSAHAEMLAIREAAAVLGNYRLLDCTLYVTLEPCAMCAGLLVHSRITQLVYGAADPKAGACGSQLNLVQHAKLNHQVAITSGILQDECSHRLSAFFRQRRAARKALKQSATPQNQNP